jgi:hypothetical protein
MTNKHNGWKSDYATSSKKEGAGKVIKPFKPFVMSRMFGIQRRSTIEDAPSIVSAPKREIK